MSKPVVLQSDYWQLRLQPDMGVQTVSCNVRAGEAWLPIMPDCESGQSELSAANFHMLPYSNRIRDGRFSFAGKDYQLEGAERHSIHGALRKKPWNVIESSDTHLLCRYRTPQAGEINWPWPIDASVHYELQANCLQSEMTLQNCGETDMPAGMGWHPYFSRTLNGASAQVRLPATGAFQDTNGDCLPIGAAQALPEFLDFNQQRALDANVRIDHCLNGFSGDATVAWPDAGIILQMRASKNCAYAVFFNPDAPYFALEPVTNANDAFNLTPKGIDAGTVVLKPGETMSAEFSLTLL